MLEAECTRCKETFNPESPKAEDIIHGHRLDGEDCGGIGIITGKWIADDEEPLELTSEELNAMEKHGWNHPDCADPDCEFHHPEVRE